MLATERATQSCRAGWWGRHPTQNLIGPDRPAVVAEIRIPLRSNHCAFQRHAGKETFALAVGVNCSCRCDCAFRRAAYWSCRSADIRTNRHSTSTGQSLDSAVIVENNHEIGHLRPDLKTPFRASG